MKRLLALIVLAIMMFGVLTGCGMAEQAVDEVETMMTDASEMMSEDKNNGEVTDGDGFIQESSSDDNRENATLNDGIGETTGSTSGSDSATNSTSNSSSGSIV